MMRKVIIFKFCLICIIILGNGENVLILKIKFLIIRFIVLLTSCLIPRILSISVLIRPINFVNMKTFGLLYYIFHTELIVLLRIFGVLCYFSLFSCRITYNN
jgi:hypothetical protein